jgi:copper resistance protein D
MEAEAIALRWLAYLNGAALLGILLFARNWTRYQQRSASILALIGAGLTLLTILLLAQSFSAAGEWLDRAMLRFLLSETPVGLIAIIRFAGLLGLSLFLLVVPARKLAAGLAIVAVGTLAWNGHAAITEGANGWVHLGGNALHLLAGLSWIGAIAAFLWAACRPTVSLVVLHSRLQYFATIGTILVIGLAVTGSANLLFIIGWSGVLTLPTTGYGQLLLLKLALFGAMLGLAAANRWWLTAKLLVQARPGLIRLSLGTELALGVIICGLVAWLGTLDPTQII